MAVALKPQDVVVLLKARLWPGATWKFAELARELGMSASEVHSAIRRASSAQLVVPRQGVWTVQRRNFLEFLIYGLRYVFPEQPGPETRGIPTGIGAPILSPLFASSGIPPVWPHAEGTVRGHSFKPLYPSVPFAALRDRDLYDGVALLDAVRGGRARERAVAVEILEQVFAKGS